MFYQCGCTVEDFVALIANMLLTDLILCRMGDVVQFQSIISLEADPASLTQIFPLLTVDSLHVAVDVLHPLRLVLAQLALQVDRVHCFCSF